MHDSSSLDLITITQVVHESKTLDFFIITLVMHIKEKYRKILYFYI
jgi:hypothetical protein